jgi:hypothetical protein
MRKDETALWALGSAPGFGECSLLMPCREAPLPVKPGHLPPIRKSGFTRSFFQGSLFP